MALRFDDKGKYYTDYVTKESVPVVIQTVIHHIRGYVYVQEDDRLSDELNKTERFLPVTQAIVLDLAGNKLYETNFLAVNRSHILWIYPEDVPASGDTYAVEELLVGQDPLVSDDVYEVETSPDDSFTSAETQEPAGEADDPTVDEAPEERD
jgi:hypothetical protein